VYSLILKNYLYNYSLGPMRGRKEGIMSQLTILYILLHQKVEVRIPSSFPPLSLRARACRHPNPPVWCSHTPKSSCLMLMLKYLLTSIMMLPEEGTALWLLSIRFCCCWRSQITSVHMCIHGPFMCFGHKPHSLLILTSVEISLLTRLNTMVLPKYTALCSF